MIYPNLHAILATRFDGLIGDGDRIPWHHSGDLKHFKSLTMNAGIIIGFKTLAGIAKNYFKDGKIVLPVRRLYVSYDDRGQSTSEIFDSLCQYGNFNKDDVYYLPSINDLPLVMKSEEKMFVVGGAQTYGKYLPYAANIYMTVIEQSEPIDYVAPVYLPETLNKELLSDVTVSCMKPPEQDGNNTANYYHITRNLRSIDDLK